MEIKTKTKQESKIEAYELLKELKQNNLPKKEVIGKVSSMFGIPYGTLYGWYQYNLSPSAREKSNTKRNYSTL